MISVGIAILQIASVFALLGLGSGVMRYVSFFRALEDRAKTKGVITFSLKVAVGAGMLAALLLFVFAEQIALGFFHNAGLVDVIRVFGLATPFLTATYVLAAALRGFQRIEYEVYATRIVESTARLALSAAVIFFGFGLFGLSVVYFLTIVLSFLICFYALEWKVFPIVFTRVKSVFVRRELLTYSLPMLFAGVLYLFMNWMDTLMLGYFRTIEEVGVYNVAMPTAALLIALSASTNQLFTPIATGLFGKNKMAEVKKLYRRVTKWNFLAGFPLFLAFFFFARQVLRVLFGPDYEGGGTALMILAFGYLAACVLSAGSELLMAFRKTHVLFVNMFAASALNFLLNYLLIPGYGMVGGAVATSASLVVYVVLSSGYVYRFAKMHPYSTDLVKPLGAGALAIAAALAFNAVIPHPAPLPLFVSVFMVLAVVYGVLVLLLKSMDEEDLELVRAFARKIGAQRFTGFLEKR